MKKILVVDDEPEVIDILRIRLEKDGYEIATANDGQEALDKVYKDKFDLIILDIMLPKMNGYQVSRLIKFSEEYKNIPIIMLTARAQEVDKKLGVETGADLYMTKPFDAKELLDAVKKFI